MEEPRLKNYPLTMINHLLLIDDDPLTEVLLEGIGSNLHLINRYVFKSGGRQALEYLSFCQKTGDFPDLIIVDLLMPEMDGFEFLEKYEELFHQSFPKCRLVIATNAIAEQKDRVLQNFASVEMFILKPFVKERFIEVHKLLFS